MSPTASPSRARAINQAKSDSISAMPNNDRYWRKADIGLTGANDRF